MFNLLLYLYAKKLLKSTETLIKLDKLCIVCIKKINKVKNQYKSINYTFVKNQNHPLKSLSKQFFSKCTLEFLSINGFWMAFSGFCVWGGGVIYE